MCPRLVAFREQWRAKEPDWFNAPVHSFGPLDARLLIVGLAPGLRGANRTGRPFTGDYAGDLLYETLIDFAFARGHSGAVASIHEAVLAAIEADGVEALLHVVTQEWPLILGIDAVALSLIVGDKGFRADGSGIQLVEPSILRRAIEAVDGVEMRKVERGHSSFGPACELTPV